MLCLQSQELRGDTLLLSHDGKINAGLNYITLTAEYTAGGDCACRTVKSSSVWKEK